MWELDYKESWVPKNWCFWTVVLEKTLESPLDCKEMKPVNPKGDQSWIFIGRTDVEAETLILWPPDAKSWLTWKDSEAGKDGKKAGGEGDDRGWDAWMASPTQWTCVWGNSRSCWWTGRPGVLQSMGSQRVSHNQATELNWTWSSFPIIYTRDYFFLVVMSWLLCQEVLVMYVSCYFWTICSFDLCVCFYAKTIWFWIGEGNGTPLQYSCLANPMDVGAC